MVLWTGNMIYICCFLVKQLLFLHVGGVILCLIVQKPQKRNKLNTPHHEEYMEYDITSFERLLINKQYCVFGPIISLVQHF